jgi:hypothetical protein
MLETPDLPEELDGQNRKVKTATLQFFISGI